jgi:hypothetical protein
MSNGFHPRRTSLWTNGVHQWHCYYCTRPLTDFEECRCFETNPPEPEVDDEPVPDLDDLEGKDHELRSRLEKVELALVEASTLIERMRHEHCVNQRWPSFTRTTMREIKRVQPLLRETLGPHEHERAEGTDLCRVCGENMPPLPSR